MKRSQNPYIFLFRRMRKYAPSKSMLMVMLSFSIISKIIWLIEPWIFGQIINTIQISGFEGRPQIRTYLLLLMGVTLGAWIFHGFSRVWEEDIKFSIGKSFTTDIFHKVTSLPMQWHNDHHSGQTIDRINKGLYALRQFSGNNYMYMTTLIFSVGSVVSLFLLWRKAAVIMLVFGAIMFFVVRKFDQYIVPLIKKRNHKEHVVMSTLFDLLSNIKTIVTLRFEGRALQTVGDKIEDVFPVFKSYRKLNERKWFSMDLLMAVVTSLVLGRYVYEQFSMTGTVLIGTFTMLFQYTQKMDQALTNFTWQYSGIVTNKADVESVEDIEQAYDALIRKKEGDVRNRQKIAITDLHFTYEDKEHETHTLKNIDVSLAPHKKIALVGESGSGKSTLLSLLRGLYDVDHVKVDIDGKEFDTLHPLMQITSLIPQEPEIFEQTIRHNLTMGIDIPDEKLWEMLRLACADDVVRDLPKGLDTDLKEKGVNLSGGQKQRIALARGLLMGEQSSILLLDEPTSSVDGINESKIYERLLEKFPDKCIICSIHKLHLVDLFDEVCVMKNGKLVEKGPPLELVKNGGAYTTMYTKVKSGTSKST